MQYNGSFAGETGEPRFNVSGGYEKYWGTFGRQDWDVYASYDQFVSAIRSGIGFTTGWSVGIGTLSQVRSSFYSLAVAPKFSLKGKYTLSPSLDITFRPGRYESYYQPEFSGRYNGISSKIGILFNARKYYVGYSVNLFSWVDNRNINNIRIFQSYLQMGYTFQRSQESKFAFTPQFLFSIQQNELISNKLRFYWKEVILTFRYKQFLFGVNKTGWAIGWQTEKLKVLLSSAGMKNHYIGNISLRYLLKKSSQPGL